MARKIEVGDTITAVAVNGHVFEYRVIGFYDSGRPRTTQWDAVHADRCTCNTWEGEDRSLPDW